MEMTTTTECAHPVRALTIVELIPDGTRTEQNGPGLSNTYEMVRIVSLCNECGAEVVRRESRHQAEYEMRCANRRPCIP